jgi:hypothetical protein
MAAYPYDNQPHDRYKWTQFLPCNDWERNTQDQLHLCTHSEAYGGVTQLHRDGDSIHFCVGRTTTFFTVTHRHPESSATVCASCKTPAAGWGCSERGSDGSPQGGSGTAL